MILIKATVADFALIYQLALPAWKEAYADILSEEQFDYMIEKMYSEESLKQQMQEGHMFFIAYSDADNAAGFVSFHPNNADSYILEKLYVLPQMHGKGAGRFLVETVESYIHEQHPGQQILLELNVNRNNKAVAFYKRMGFRIDQLVDENIGNGFYKNDYIMQKIL